MLHVRFHLFQDKFPMYFWSDNVNQRYYPVPQPYCSLAFSGGYVRGRWLKVALLDSIDLWTTISISKTF